MLQFFLKRSEVIRVRKGGFIDFLMSIVMKESHYETLKEVKESILESAEERHAVGQVEEDMRHI
jgi:hypothetical protein